MSDDGVRIERVRSGRAARAFVTLPYRLHRAAPYWIPPLRAAEFDRWSSRHNTSLIGRPVERFIAWRGKQVVGRIAAIIDEAFARIWLPRTGFVGFFEALDGAVAAALLQAAEQQLRIWGATTAIGPVNLTTHEEVGLLIDGFDVLPTLLSPWNPASYVTFFETAGYSALRDYQAYRWRPDAEYSPVMQRLLRRHRQRGTAPLEDDVVVRGFNAGKFNEEVWLLHQLYNRSFADLWGFVPLSWQEFRERALSFKPFYRPSLIRIAEKNRYAVGFAVVLPDINQALRSLDGRLLPFGWLRLMRRVRRIRRGRFMLLGVLPSHRGRGVAALLADSVRPLLAEAGIDDLEISLVQQQNDNMRAVIDAMGCERSKTYRLYLKQLPRDFENS